MAKLFWIILHLGIIQRSSKTSKKQEEKIKLNFTSSNTEEYNSLFNITELKDAIAVSKDTATGPDDIHYQMLKQLPETALDTLLHIFNGIWTTGVFPESWRLATIIPIPKPGKDHAEPTNCANKLPLQNTRENDKQTTCLVLRI